MRKLFLLAVISCSCAQPKMTTSVKLSSAQYSNPIIEADYSDPDAIRVGDDFFMTASSFSHFPGLPILKSGDLVNWQIVGHAVLTYPDTTFAVPHHGDAIWAPSIRYHNNEYYIYFGDPDKGVFMTKAANASGPWGPLKLVKKVTGWIDCCPLWDENGKAYLVHAYANSRVGLKSVLMINEMSADGEEILGSSTIVYNGQIDQPTMEGPKLYQRNGYYYIFTPAGGVRDGWQTVLRSKNIYGPYESRIVLEQGSTKINGPHQGAWVQTACGDDWFIHFQDKDAYGRVVCLEPMKWTKDNWPLIGIDYDKNGIGEPVARYNVPTCVQTNQKSIDQTSDEFDGQSFGLQWQWQANPKSSWSKTIEEKGVLRLYNAQDNHPVNLWGKSNLLLQKFPAPNFRAQAKIISSELESGIKPALIVFGVNYYYLSVEKIKEQKLMIRLIRCEGAPSQNHEIVLDSVEVKNRDIIVGVDISENMVDSKFFEAHGQFIYGSEENEMTKIGGTFKAREGKWVGAKVGVFVDGSQSGYADFDWFRITNTKKF